MASVLFCERLSPSWVPGWRSSKESACWCRRRSRHAFDPWVEKIPYSRKCNLLQYSRLENPTDSHGVAKSRDRAQRHICAPIAAPLKKKAAVTGLAQMRGSPRTRIGCQAVRQLSCFSEFMPYGTIEHFESHCLVLAAEFWHFRLLLNLFQTDETVVSDS